MRKSDKPEENAKEEGKAMSLIKLTLAGITTGAIAYYASRFYTKYKDEKINEEKERKQRKIEQKIKEIEEREYPKFLSYMLYIESSINRLPTDMINKLNEKYGLRSATPIVNLDELAYNQEFREALRNRMKKEPEALKLVKLTGAISVDYNNFLLKKAEIEADKIINELMNSES